MSIFGDIANAVSDIAHGVADVVGDVAQGAASLAEGALGAVGDVMKVAFAPMDLLNSVGNMLAQGIGQAVTEATQLLTQVAGMPKFVADEVGKIVKGVIDGLQQGGSNPACDHQAQQKCGNSIQDFVKGMVNDIVDAFQNHKAECDKNGGAAKGGGKSWFVALMQALGEVQNKQAAKVEKLSKEVSDALGAGDDSSGSKQAQFDKMEEYKAEAKLQEVLANVTKSIGDSLGNSISTVARAQ